jgi:crotonobetainyl-CoA hydratase
VAAVNGAASGGGFMIAALADAIVAAEGAHFALPEIDLGSPPLAALVVLEPWLGAAGAYDLVQSGRRMSAAEAEHRGLVRVLLPREAVFAQAEGIARELIAKHARAFAASKAWLRKPMRAELERAETAMVAWRAADGE